MRCPRWPVARRGPLDSPISHNSIGLPVVFARTSRDRQEAMRNEAWMAASRPWALSGPVCALSGTRRSPPPFQCSTWRWPARGLDQDRHAARCGPSRDLSQSMDQGRADVGLQVVRASPSRDLSRSTSERWTATALRETSISPAVDRRETSNAPQGTHRSANALCGLIQVLSRSRVGPQ